MSKILFESLKKQLNRVHLHKMTEKTGTFSFTKRRKRSKRMTPNDKIQVDACKTEVIWNELEACTAL